MNRLAVTAMVSGLLFVALATLAAGGPLAADIAVAGWLRRPDGVAGGLVDALNLVGQTASWDGLVVLAGAGLWLAGRRFEALVLVGGVIGADLGAEALKTIVGRARPSGISVTDLVTQASYPSGHVTRAVVTSALLCGFGWNRQRWRPLLAGATLAIVTAMGAARIMSGEHWFTDVVGAILYGLFAASMIGAIAGRLRRERRRGFRGDDDQAGGR